MPLRLKSIELQGYKTFASRTLFEFSGGITAIVGPNGSGKSNIADAIRWVLGEQSYLLLRGKKTEDMIFSGSELRPRAGMAQATVTFDNTTGWLPLEYAEVELARHAFRDGRNDYLLNGRHVRLRDINEVLAQAGLSERTYTVLGQGLVDASLALRADERRRLFEEAAGVALYRTRREEALKRLESTNRNLERVLDILSELEPRLRSLERQAKRAIDYSRVQAELKEVLRAWYGYHWHRVQDEVVKAREVAREQEDLRREAAAAAEAAQGDLLNFHQRMAGLRAELSTWQRRASELQTQREGVVRDLAVLAERRGALTASVDSTESEVERTRAEHGLAAERLVDVEQEAERLQADLAEAQREHAAARGLLEAKQASRARLEEQLEEARADIDASNQARAEAQARLDEIRQRRNGFDRRAESTRAAISAAELVVRQAEEKLERARVARLGAEKARDLLDGQIAAARAAADALDQKRRGALEARAGHEAEQSRQRAQLGVLEETEQGLLGYADGARFLLDATRQSRLKGARGALSAALDVPDELETAISAALGDTLDAVLLPSEALDEALLLLEGQGAGRAALLPLDGNAAAKLPAAPHVDCVGNAAELVDAPEDLRPAVDLMLGQTLIARTRASAKAILRELPPQARVVTLRGEVFRGDGLVFAGGLGKPSSLGRPRRKRELVAALAESAQRLHDAEATLQQLSGALKGGQDELAALEAGGLEASQTVAAAQADEHHADLDLDSARRLLQWQRSQLQNLVAESEEAASVQEEFLAEESGRQDRAAEAHAKLRLINEQLAEAGLDELRSQVAYWATRVAVAEQAAQRGLAVREERGQEAARLEAGTADLTERLGSLQQKASDLETEQASLRDALTSSSKELDELRLRMEPVEADLENAQQEEARLQEVDAAARHSLAASERGLGQTQLDLARREDALSNLRDKIIDDFGLVLFDYADEVAGPVPLPFEGLVQDLPVLDELPPDLEDQLSRQRVRLRRMGAINPEARAEFERERERLDFLKGQVEDSQKAKMDLHQVLAELDELTRRDFARTFEAVDREFRQSFVRLFGGGSARLALTDPENLVETGIEIEARLPGRREQGLALLSGGERSLTAIALVFALLKVSPTPVCVMDEVDAMLDEANVGRFRDLLAELSKETQFIIITHNRNTVQAANVIYGVTMGRDSTSQVISLKLDEVTDELLNEGVAPTRAS